MKYSYYILKRKVEDIFILPFILLGRAIASIRPRQQQYKIYFFFPFYHTGGAEKVHAMLAQATGDSNCVIYFTRKSYDHNFYDDFLKSGCVIKDISKYIDNKLLYFLNLIYRGIITGYINNQSSNPIIFNGQCNFGYKISPWVKKNIAQVELIHSFNTFSWIRLPFLPFIKQTIMISKVRIEDHLKQYEKLKVPVEFKSKIKYIVNGITLPNTVEQKNYNEKLKVLYVGRGTPEKRVHIIAKIAEKAASNKLAVEFLFMGDVIDAIPTTLIKYCHLIGHKTNADEIANIYAQAHIVIITSSTEGFPLAIQEGMAYGCIIMATPVGDIPVHIKNNENGFLFSSVLDEDKIVEEGISHLALLLQQSQLAETMSENNKAYAQKHFSIDIFNQQYRLLFLNVSKDN